MEHRHLGRSGLKISEIIYGNWLTHASQVEDDRARACVRAALDAGARAATDVTGFGLAGHALEMARGSGCTVRLDWASVPLLSGARDLAGAGHVTGASGRNWASYGPEVTLPEGFNPLDRALLSDPQTSGGERLVPSRPAPGAGVAQPSSASTCSSGMKASAVPKWCRLGTSTCAARSSSIGSAEP